MGFVQGLVVVPFSLSRSSLKCSSGANTRNEEIVRFVPRPHSWFFQSGLILGMSRYICVLACLPRMEIASGQKAGRPAGKGMGEEEEGGGVRGKGGVDLTLNTWAYMQQAGYFET